VAKPADIPKGKIYYKGDSGYRRRERCGRRSHTRDDAVLSGHGLNGRLWGPACANLQALDVVTADRE
jgi:hypothetical protein